MDRPGEGARLREIERELERAGLRLQWGEAPEGVTAAVIARRDLGTARADAQSGATRLEAAERAYARWRAGAPAGGGPARGPAG